MTRLICGEVTGVTEYDRYAKAYDELIARRIPVIERSFQFEEPVISAEVELEPDQLCHHTLPPLLGVTGVKCCEGEDRPRPVLA